MTLFFVGFLAGFITAFVFSVGIAWLCLMADDADNADREKALAKAIDDAEIAATEKALTHGA